MAKKYDDIGGVWRTIGGRRVFIKTGQSLSSAMKESGKFKASDVKREEYHKAKAEHEVMESQKKVLENKNPDMSDKLHEKYNEAKKKNKELEMLYDEPDAWKYEGDVSKLKGKHISKEYSKNYDYEKNMPEGAKFSKMLEENNVKTFADEITEEDKKNLKKLEEIIKKDKETGNVVNRMKVIDDQERYDRLYDRYKEDGMSENKIKDLLGERPKTGLERTNKIETISKQEYDNKTIKQLNNEMLGDKYKGKGLTPSLVYSNHRRIDIANNGNGEKIAIIWKDGKIERKTILPKNVKGDKTKDYFDKYLKDLDNSSNQINNSLRRKAYQKYLKEHPASKLSYEEFLKK